MATGKFGVSKQAAFLAPGVPEVYPRGARGGVPVCARCTRRAIPCLASPDWPAGLFGKGSAYDNDGAYESPDRTQR